MSCADQALEILDELVLAGSDGLDMRNREQVWVVGPYASAHESACSVWWAGKCQLFLLDAWMG